MPTNTDEASAGTSAARVSGAASITSAPGVQMRSKQPSGSTRMGAPTRSERRIQRQSTTAATDAAGATSAYMT